MTLEDWTDGGRDAPLYIVSPVATSLGVPTGHLLYCLDTVYDAMPKRWKVETRRAKAATAVRALLLELARLDRPLGATFQRVAGRPFSTVMADNMTPATDALRELARAGFDPADLAETAAASSAARALCSATPA